MSLNHEKPMLGQPQPTYFFIDEFGSYAGGFNDALRRELRAIDGVPNASYVVGDGRVFVFDKLVKLVDTWRAGSQLADISHADLPRLVEEAKVSAVEAVERWGIVPYPYKAEEVPTGGSVIRHVSFDALLPGTFQDKADLHAALASLLLGDNLPGAGDFDYRGQAMTLREPLDTAQLPPRPSFGQVEPPEGLDHMGLNDTVFAPGFAPLSEALFDDVKERAATWWNDGEGAARYARGHVADLWNRASDLRLETLDDLTDVVPDYGKDDLAELRPLYPELSMLSDGSLFKWFHAYQSGCCYNRGWTAYRDDDFLFYLLGKIAGRPYEAKAARGVGQWAGFALLRGDKLDVALAFGAAAVLYECAMNRLVYRIVAAMRFLAGDESTRQGGKILTLVDFFKMARPTYAKVGPVEQDLTNLTPVDFEWGKEWGKP